MSALARRLRKKQSRRREGYRHNPPLFTDLLEQAIPAGAGFIATRGLTKIGMTLVDKRWPSKSKHIGAGVSIAAFLASWYLGHKVKFLQRWHVPITAGAFIAAGVNLIQIYIPKLGWLFGDPSKLTGGTTVSMLPAGTQDVLPAHFEEVQDDPANFYNDAMDSGRYAPTNGTNNGPPNSVPTDPIADLDDDSLGVFAGGLAS